MPAPVWFFFTIGDPEGGLSIRVLVCTHPPPLTLEQGQPTKSVIQLGISRSAKSTQRLNVVQVVGCLAVELTMFSYVQNPQGWWGQSWNKKYMDSKKKWRRSKLANLCFLSTWWYLAPKCHISISKSSAHRVFLKVKIDLNAGTGEPCAGQRRVEYLPL